MTLHQVHSMRIVFFCHSLRSCWNHGNAHFLRGLVRELRARGHHVAVHEPRDAWSVENLVREHGAQALEAFRVAYPGLDSVRYSLDRLDLDEAVDGADLVIVHEWSDHALVRRLGELRRRGARFRLLFHDTHHRSVTDRASMAAYDLSAYDGVLAFGEVIRAIYEREGWTRRAWTLHEAADTAVFRPHRGVEPARDLVWIGNWGDEERTAELQTFLLDPARDLGLRARVHGVRYPEHALEALAAAGIEHAGWLPNHEAPRAFAEARFTVHVPRRPYAQALPGIPTIRVFEALACGIPLISAPWEDAEGLFTPGRDFVFAKDGAEMRARMRDVLHDRAFAASLVEHGLATIAARHTCAHRAEQLLRIARELSAPSASIGSTPTQSGESTSAKPTLGAETP